MSKWGGDNILTKSLNNIPVNITNSPNTTQQQRDEKIGYIFDILISKVHSSQKTDCTQPHKDLKGENI